MAEQSRNPVFRSPKATLTGVLRSAAFLNSRERAGAIIDDPAALRGLADEVESLDHVNHPSLFAIWDRVAAAVRLLRAKADTLEADQAEGSKLRPTPASTGVEPARSAGPVARERLIVAALHYLITPVDLIPDFRAGGYIDDALLLSWIFGTAVNELDPFIADQSNS